MTFKKKTLLSLTTLSIVATVAFSTISCTETKPEAIPTKIILQTNQTKVFPLMVGLAKLIPLYNEQMKNQAGFLPIELQDGEVTKANSELELAQNVVKNIASGSNNLIPELIIGNQGGAFIINQYNRLFDLSTTAIQNDIFLPRILQGHNNLAGQAISNEKIYNIPFDLTDTDAIVLI